MPKTTGEFDFTTATKNDHYILSKILILVHIYTNCRQKRRSNKNIDTSKTISKGLYYYRYCILSITRRSQIEDAPKVCLFVQK